MRNGAFPSDDTLAEVARAVDEAGIVAHLMDADFHLVWLSREFRAMIGTDDPVRLGYGEHIVTACESEPWQRSFGHATMRQIVAKNAKYWIARDSAQRALGRLPELRPVLEGTEPVALPPAWTYTFDMAAEDGVPPSRINGLGTVVRAADGTLVGMLETFNSALPAHITGLLVRGDERLFERMARLVDPGQRQAAVMFADLDGSSRLSKRLPTAGYFALIRALTTRIDAETIERRGIPGKHAGDGATAFFLGEDLGSPSAAARAAIETARALKDAASEAVSELGDDLLDGDECTFNVGLHWGATLYIGQVVTGGRLEVTAIGDEVNEAARIQETAKEGQLLASKLLLEQLTGEDAGALGIDTAGIAYRQIVDLDDAPPKAVRDAGGLPIVTV